jgi:hypothetical protein
MNNNKKRKITQKGYKEFQSMTVSELEAVSRMALAMAERAKKLEDANEINLDHLLIIDTSMRAAFYALHKSYAYQVNPRYFGSNAAKVINQSLRNVIHTVENIEEGLIK